MDCPSGAARSWPRRVYNFMDILRRYYGDDIELVLDAPVRDLAGSYPGTPLRLGDFGPQVLHRPSDAQPGGAELSGDP